MIRQIAAFVAVTLFALVITMMIAGCSDKPSVFPNQDPALRKTKMQFAADAAKRFPYKLEAPRAGSAEARAQVGYSLNTLEITNLSSEDWQDVEVWVNQQYVVFVANMETHKLKSLPFSSIYNENGDPFPMDNSSVRVNKVEIFRDGKMYDVTTKLAD